MNAAPESSRLPIGIIGAGGIGRMHVERALVHADVRPAAIADPSPEAARFAAAHGIAYYPDHRALLERRDLEAVIVATPNASHRDVALDCIARGVPTLVEKPIADTLASARKMCAAANAASVPLMVGHHRRHNPIARRAHELVASGVLGRPVSANAMSTWLKPDAYYDVAWRREPGGGPVLINLIHDIDLLRFLFGDIASIQACTSSAVRGFAVEDTAAVLVRFANGALGTITVTDAAVTPWNWDLAAGEAAHYPRQDVNSHYLSGTDGSLTLPGLELWQYRGKRGWHETLTVERTVVHQRDPYVEQLRHVRAVCEGRESPLSPGNEGLRTLAATLAVHESAASGAPVAVARE